MNSTQEAEQASKNVAEHLEGLRVCSLSATSANQLVWAHYASGFAGAAIEVEIPDATEYNLLEPEGKVRVRKLRYDFDRAHLGMLPYDSPCDAAYESLSAKLNHWSYEEEIRIIADSDALIDGKYYDLPSTPKSVTIGFRMPVGMQCAIASACTTLGIHFGVCRPMSGSRPPALETGFWQEFLWREKGISIPLPKWVPPVST